MARPPCVQCGSPGFARDGEGGPLLCMGCSILVSSIREAASTEETANRAAAAAAALKRRRDEIRARTGWRSGDDGAGSKLRPKSKGGRPRGTGAFANREEFLGAVAMAVKHLKQRGRKPTQANVAEFFTASGDPRHPKCKDRQVRRWRETYGYRLWRDLLADVARLYPELVS